MLGWVLRRSKFGHFDQWSSILTSNNVLEPDGPSKVVNLILSTPNILLYAVRYTHSVIAKNESNGFTKQKISGVII